MPPSEMVAVACIFICQDFLGLTNVFVSSNRKPHKPASTYDRVCVCVCVYVGGGDLHVALGGQRCLIPLELDYRQL